MFLVTHLLGEMLSLCISQFMTSDICFTLQFSLLGQIILLSIL